MCTCIVKKHINDDLIQSYDLSDQVRKELKKRRKKDDIDNIHYVLYAPFKP